MKRIILILILLLLSLNLIYAEGEEDFIYNDEGKRDPFFPLIGKDGQYRLETELIYSSAQLNLSGIVWDAEGESSCLINNQVVKVGEDIGGFRVKEINKNSVTFVKEGKEYTIKLSEEEELTEEE